MLFNTDTPPTSPVTALLWPVIWVGIAVTIWYFAYRMEMDERTATWKWSALLPWLISVIVGVSALKMFTMANFGDFADANGMGRKVIYSLYAAAALPILGLAAMVGLTIHERMNRNQRF